MLPGLSGARGSAYLMSAQQPLVLVSRAPQAVPICSVVDPASLNT